MIKLLSNNLQILTVPIIKEKATWEEKKDT